MNFKFKTIVQILRKTIQLNAVTEWPFILLWNQKYMTDLIDLPVGSENKSQIICFHLSYKYVYLILSSLFGVYKCSFTRSNCDCELRQNCHKIAFYPAMMG